MIINYDRNPNRTIDEKLESLILHLQLAFNEMENRLDEQEKDIQKLSEKIDSLGI